jgi:NitT/TauT family transport system permease protein
MSAADPTTLKSFVAATIQRLAAQRRRERINYILLTVTGIIGLLLIWEASVDLFKMPPYIIPSPDRVLNALWSGLAVPLNSRVGFYVPLWNTLEHATLGFLIGASLGLIIGSLMAEYRSIEIILMPYAFALQSLPKIAIAPLVIVWCGFGNGSKVVMAAMLTFFPMLVNSFAGIRSTEPERIDLMKALSASRLQTYLRVKLPTAAPYIFAGLDMGVVYALLGTIVAEFLGAQEGIGVVITQAQAVTDVAGVFAALVILGGVGIALHMLIRITEKCVVHWSDRHK